MDARNTAAPAARPAALAASKSTALSPRAQAEHTIRTMLERSESEFAKALPTTLGMNAKAVVRAVVTEVKMSELLAKCEPLSIVRCAMECAQLGLLPNRVTGHVYLVPFKDNKIGKDVCTTIVGYRGLIDLARRSGNISTFDAYVVHERDVFEYRLGDDPKITHAPYQGSDDPGHMIAAYAIVRLRDGGVQRLVMTTREIDRIRSKSKSGRSDYSPWATDYEEMAKKTVVRRIWKMLPVSVEALNLIERERVREEGDPEERKAAGMDPETGVDLPGEADRTYDVNPDTGEVTQQQPVGEMRPDEARDTALRLLTDALTRYEDAGGSEYADLNPSGLSNEEIKAKTTEILDALAKRAAAKPAGKGGAK